MKYLFIGAHTDDLELCCGGTIAKLIEQGHTTTLVTLSSKYDGIDLRDEWKSATDCYAPRFDNRVLHDFKSREFDKSRQEILDLLVKFTDYHFVITHSPLCFHQDHSTVGREAIRAFKHTNLLTFQGDWNQRKFIKNYFVKLEHRHVQKKLEALACYKSQLQRPYFNQDVIVGAMHVNGMMADTTFAEAFQVINMVHA